MNKGIIEIAVTKMAESPKAMLVTDGIRDAWIPKCCIHDSVEEKGELTSIFIHEKLANEKGLI